jgi:hypothetical protein
MILSKAEKMALLNTILSLPGVKSLMASMPKLLLLKIKLSLPLPPVSKSSPEPPIKD